MQWVTHRSYVNYANVAPLQGIPSLEKVLQPLCQLSSSAKDGDFSSAWEAQVGTNRIFVVAFEI